eukprot:3887152-Lingulodinium_polyedra.AAC.1
MPPQPADAARSAQAATRLVLHEGADRGVHIARPQSARLLHVHLARQGMQDQIDAVAPHGLAGRPRRS